MLTEQSTWLQRNGAVFYLAGFIGALASVGFVTAMWLRVM